MSLPMEDDKEEEEPFMGISEPLRVHHTHQELLKESFVDGIAAPHWAETERPHRIMKDILSPRQGDASRLADDVEAERIEGGDSPAKIGSGDEPRCREPVGIATAIVVIMKAARQNASIPDVSMWWPHTMNPTTPIPAIANTMDL